MRFRKKPIVIEAFKWTGDVDQTEDPEWIVEAIKEKRVIFVNVGSPQVMMQIETLEGWMFADLGDYIIKGIKGEIYPCKANIFEATYDKVD